MKTVDGRRWTVVAGLLIAACSRGGEQSSPDSSATVNRPPSTVITDSATIYEARGPGWHLEIYGEGIRYTGPEDSTGVLFPAGRVDGNDSASTWSSKRTGSRAPYGVRAEFLRTSCAFGGTSYRYRAVVVIDNEPRQGCAQAGTAPRPPATAAPPHR